MRANDVLIRFVLAFLTALTGCGSFGTDVAPARVEANADGGAVVDAAADAELGDRANVVENGDFELGCGRWVGFQATLAVEASGRTGSACRVCGSVAGPDGGFAIDQVLRIRPTKGKAYKAEIWARSDQTDNTLSGSELSPNLRTYDATPETPIDATTELPTLLSPNWQRLAATITLTSDAKNFDVYVYFPYKAGFPTATSRCFVVDDASVVEVVR